MKLDFSTHLADLAIDSETVGILRDYSIHTVRDLAHAMTDKKLGQMLDGEQQINVVEAIWAWIGLPLERKGATA